ncbi:hypothetical protein GCE86_00950 [Micromonospora terminaliae]|uniref:Uncharacterized protein n=1 Tax=Micromonospora terminaliae TaxID=1914461 RepID=A0AAJ2ZGK0_9ACTN|nr:hypothetical protein [Micromonospora terminaliae]NES28538.1 hypothetical protein [Micromonospora terminaliae]QGL45738.1 hypothetical protein GCE86_00950 [Micromonospora terminaliae]
MSYDLIFVPRRDDQSWDDALEAAEDADGDERPSGEVWARLVAAARQVLGEVSVFEGDHNYELTHEPTGIQLSYYPAEAGITVPYWYRGADARTVVTAMYQLGEAVQSITGLPGYNPQVDLPLSDAAARLELAVKCFDDVAASFAQRGISSPSNG